MSNCFVPPTYSNNKKPMRVKIVKNVKKITNNTVEIKPIIEETPEDYVQSLIKEKELMLMKRIDEIAELQHVIKCMKEKTLNDVILNQRRELISKMMNKLPKNDKSKDEKLKLYENMMKDIKKFDKFFNIDSNSLNIFDVKTTAN